ncbi:helix-turn-helix transcriptional regulator [Sphingobium naphthae]|uniref:Helix-turn-helix transcriptional regulator n=1 Tax=Sphingobium naphthae TaxID=1886786 RepID=A0ABU4A227_9SPHN|nr:helix-turn-helix transcriptional regulator [Sphingobium naphthae]MDV5825819.1 helix-turn-helix transcriptional regulator [Sphingobium naphthae]
MGMCGLSGEQAHKISQRFLRRQIQFCCALLADHEPVLGRCCSGYASTTHACYYFFMSNEIRPYRFRLPAGLSHFDSRFAKALKALRADRKETQQVVADAIGITRTAYARFENGKSWPRPDTFEALQDYFEVFGEQLAEARQPGEWATARAEPNFDTVRADAIHDMGRYLRKCRQTKKYTLRQVAAWSGVSAAQLSRIERGECANSPIIGAVDEDKNLHKDKQRLTFTNQVIREIYHGTFIPPKNE